MRITLSVFILLTSALAQDQSVIKVGTRLVQFNVIVRDKTGPVSDLRKEDFTLLDRGIRREIAVFRMDSRTGHDPSAILVPPPSNVFTNRRTGESNSTVLLFDGVNTRYADQGYARLQIIKFIERLKPGDRVAIYSLGRELRVVHDFSSDVASLIEAARALRIRISEGDDRSVRSEADSQAEAASTSRFAVVFGGMMDNLASQAAESNLTAQVNQTELALLAIARYFGSVPGRKNLVWVSSGFPVSIGARFDDRTRFDAKVEDAARALMDANVSVYPVDARGLMVRPAPFTYAQHDQMLLLAARTGGKAFFNSNDVEGSIRRALDDSLVTYTLGFYLPRDEMDSKFHSIRISVARKAVNVRAREGYIAYGDTIKSEGSREVAMKQVLAAALDATALPMTFRLERLAKPNAIQVTSMIDPKNLVFSEKDSHFVDVVDFVVAQQSRDGRNLRIDTELMNIAFTPERYRQIMGADIELKTAIELQPQTDTIRVMFYDRNSGLIGSAHGLVKLAQQQ